MKNETGQKSATVRLKCDHIKHGDVVIGETTIHFDFDGISGGVSQAVARHAVGVPGFTIHEGELTEAEHQPDDKLVLTIELRDPSGREVLATFERTGKIEEMFPNDQGHIVLTMPKEKPGDWWSGSAPAKRTSTAPSTPATAPSTPASVPTNTPANTPPAAV